MIDVPIADQYSDHMSQRVSVTDAKARLLALLDDVEAGDEIELTRHGRLVARIVPARGGGALKGRHAGTAWTEGPAEDLFSTGEPWAADVTDATGRSEA